MILEAEITLSMSINDKRILSEFLHAILWGSEVGYVLYGEKPICVESYNNGNFDITSHLNHHLSTSIAEGLRIWKQLQLPHETPKFLFLVKNASGKQNYSQIIFVNKKAFHDIFSKHSFLFQYVLGPGLTSDKFLKELQKSEENFFNFIKNDKVLIGTSLGFGFENSLFVGRSEMIRENIVASKNSKNEFSDSFFSLKKKNKLTTLPLEYFNIQPSLGYQCLKHEINSIDNKIECASYSLENYSPKLIFGRTIDSPSTHLIHSYENTQLKILNELENSQWIEKILTQYYGEPVKIFIKNSEPKNEIFSINDLSSLIAEVIYDRITDELEEENKNTLTLFIEGMKEAERREDAHYIAPFFYEKNNILFPQDRAFQMGFRIWSFYKFGKEFITLDCLIKKLEKMEKTKIPIITSSLLPLIHGRIYENINRYEKELANSQFLNFEKEKKIPIKCLEKNYLYYQQIAAGSGAQIDNDSLVQVSYNLKTPHGNIIEEQNLGTILDLKRTIKAFRISFPQMKVGEEGILYISPEWGIKEYLSPPYFSPYLIAKFKIHKVI